MLRITNPIVVPWMVCREGPSLRASQAPLITLIDHIHAVMLACLLNIGQIRSSIGSWPTCPLVFASTFLDVDCRVSIWLLLRVTWKRRPV